MIGVDLSAVEAFLGCIHDPAPAPREPIDDTAFRAIAEPVEQLSPAWPDGS